MDPFEAIKEEDHEEVLKHYFLFQFFLKTVLFLFQKWFLIDKENDLLSKP